MKECLVVIPARYGSTRFPGKVLAKLSGQPVVEWCYRAAKAARVGPVLVATEDSRVIKAARAFGAKAVLTSESCVSGTDRVYEAAKPYKTPFVINLQGDCPLMAPATLRRIVALLSQEPRADIATAVIALKEESRALNPNVVKAVLSAEGRALYFSRAAIPYPRNCRAPQRFEHLGIYGFRRSSLKRFVNLPASPLEQTESLEQLRALEAGMSIYAAVVKDLPVAIDTPEDLRHAQNLARKLKMGPRSPIKP